MRAAKIRGEKVKIWKKHLKIYKTSYFQNCPVQLPNDCTEFDIVETGRQPFFNLKSNNILLYFSLFLKTA